MSKLNKNKCNRLWKDWAKDYGEQASKSKYAYYCDGNKISERTQKNSDADVYDNMPDDAEVKKNKKIKK